MKEKNVLIINQNERPPSSTSNNEQKESLTSSTNSTNVSLTSSTNSTTLNQCNIKLSSSNNSNNGIETTTIHNEESDEELKAVYKSRQLEFHQISQQKKHDSSLLVLEKKGLVKEISAKFQTPDTASFTRMNPHTHTSIVERIAFLKKENERKKVEFETSKRERVIILVDENEHQANLAQEEALRDRLYNNTKHTKLSSSKSEDNLKLQQEKEKEKEKDEKDEKLVITSTTSSVANQVPLTWKKFGNDVSAASPSSSSPLSSSPSQSLNKSKIIGRRRRDGRNPPPTLVKANVPALHTYLTISPTPPAQSRPSKPPLPISSDTSTFFKNFISASTSNETVSIEPFSPTSPDLYKSNNINDRSSSSSSSFLSSSPPTISSLNLMNATTSLRVRALQSPFKIHFILPNYSSIMMQCRGNETIESVKDRLIQELTCQRLSQLEKQQQQQDQSKHLDLKKLRKFDPDSYLILDMDNNPLEKSQSLNKFEYILGKRARSLIPKLRLVEKTNYLDAHPRDELSDTEYEVVRQILPKASTWKGQEIDHFRRVSARLRFELLNDIKGAVNSSLSIRLSPLPLPYIPGKILVSVFLPILQVTKTLELENGETADGFLERLFSKSYSKHLPPNVSPNDFILKVMGCSEYIHGPYDIKTFDYIRKCIIQGSKTQLVLIQRPKIEQDVPPFKPRFDYPPELPIKFEVGHSSSKSMYWEDLSNISIRDIKRPLKVKVLGVYNIPTHYLNKDDDNVSVIVSISLYHGLECLGQSSTGIEPITPPSFFGENPTPSIPSPPPPQQPPTLQSTNSQYNLLNSMGGGSPSIVVQQELPDKGSSVIITSTSSLSAQWNETVVFPNIDYSNIPKETRLCISLYATKSSSSTSSTPSSNSNSNSSSTSNPPTTTDQQESSTTVDLKKDFPIGWINLTVCDYQARLRSGVMELKLWPDDVANPLATCMSNQQSSTAVSLFVEFEQFALPVIFPTINHNVPSVEPPTINSKDMREFFESITKLDPLSEMSREKYQQLWALRHYAMLFPQVLPRLMLSVPWNQPSSVDEIHSLIDRWPRLNSYDALELLDAKHADQNVRDYAVSCLEELPEEELLDILLQLVQILKVEPYHDSKLARFLLNKSILNRSIGHSFFWYLKSDLHLVEVAERFGLYIEAYLHSCGTHRQELLRQIQVIDGLTEVAKKIKPLKDQDRRGVLLKELDAFDWPKRFQITLNPKFESNGLIINKSKYMDSKKLPLRLSFTNIDMGAETIEVIFKVGDDLRQDMLTLQMIRLMDKLWQKEGYDFKLSPYGCISCGDMIGMIEVVLNSETTARIQKGAGGATAAFKLDPLANWLRENNKSDAEYEKAVDTFVLSCAGYCVATYVLGIGDRHNDNLMCTRLGRLFHIDFGHFLGNYKKKFGIKRERAKFVFTPDFCYVMGGKDSPKFVQFVNYCCTAYNILRKHARLFMNLFAMMVSTGIPELRSLEDLNYLQEAFSLELTDEKAREKFVYLIHESLATKTTQLNNMIHIIARG